MVRNMGNNNGESGPITLIVIVFLIMVLGMAYLKFPQLLIREKSSAIPQTVYYGGTQGSFESSGSDLLANARAYLDTHPVYHDGYYETGYPSDNYGVCTDVIAFALRDAGIDLMELVYQDELQNPDRYDVDTPDKCIDFRRVKNLNVYFQSHALSLTTDIYQTGEWQPGDIVLWQDHAGFIGSQRNGNGIPYILHLTSSQAQYEEDILESRNQVMGHYRIR